MNTTKNDPTRKIGYRWVVWVIAILATAVPWYLHSAWSIIGIPIQEQLHLNLSQYGILGSIIMLGPAIFSIPVGNLNNRYGSKPLVCTGMVIILAGILFMTRAQSFPTLIASRLIQGLGFALVWTPSQTLSAKWFTRDEISTASGGNTVGLGLGGILALVSSNLVDSVGWRTFLLISAGAILVILLLVALLVSSYPTQRGFASVEEIEKNLGIAQPQASGGAKTGSSGSIWTWKFFSCYCLWFLCMGLYTTFTSWTPMVFKLKGWSSASGGYITALSLAFGVAALLAGGPLADKIGRRHHQVRICALILALTYAIVGFAPTPLVATISAVIAGTIAYYWNAPYVGLLGTIAPSDKFEIVMGTNNCFAAAGAVVLPYLMGFLTGDGSLANLRFAFIILLILGLIMFGLGFFLHDPVSRKKS